MNKFIKRKKRLYVFWKPEYEVKDSLLFFIIFLEPRYFFTTKVKYRKRQY